MARREKWLSSEFLVVCIFPHPDWMYRDLSSKYPFSVQMRENTDKEKLKLRFFSRSVEYHCLFCAYFSHLVTNPVGIYLLKVTNRNTRTRCEIFWKLIIKTSELRLTKSSHMLKQTCSFQLQACLSMCDLFDRRRYGLFIVNFEHISHLILVLVLLTFYY